MYILSMQLFCTAIINVGLMIHRFYAQSPTTYMVVIANGLYILIWGIIQTVYTIRETHRQDNETDVELKSC